MIDVSVVCGAAPPYAVEDARRELRAHAVSRGLVAVQALRQEVANERALAAADNGLLPVGTVNPMQYLDWSAELERVQAAGAVALRLFPDVQRWTVRSEALCAIAKRVRVPLLVAVSRFGDASAIGAATEGCEAVVLVGAHYTQVGDCLAALERWPHLYLETSRLAHFRAIETVVKAVGFERVLFGSGAPGRPVQAALNAVLSARIGDDEKRAILGGNAGQVFALAREGFDLPAYARGAGLVDVHGHFGALGLATPVVCPTQQIAEAERHGVIRTVASSLRAIAEDVNGGNAEAFAAVSEALKAYVVVDPRGPRGCVSSDGRCLPERGRRGGKSALQLCAHADGEPRDGCAAARSCTTWTTDAHPRRWR